MIPFLIEHQFWAAVAIYWIFSAAVSSLPEPGPNSNPGYLWLFRFAHTVAGNITTAFGSRIPGLKVLGLVLSLYCCYRSRPARRTTRPIPRL